MRLTALDTSWLVLATNQLTSGRTMRISHHTHVKLSTSSSTITTNHPGRMVRMRSAEVTTSRSWGENR